MKVTATFSANRETCSSQFQVIRLHIFIAFSEKLQQTTGGSCNKTTASDYKHRLNTLKLLSQRRRHLTCRRLFSSGSESFDSLQFKELVFTLTLCGSVIQPCRVYKRRRPSDAVHLASLNGSAKS